MLINNTILFSCLLEDGNVKLLRADDTKSRIDWQKLHNTMLLTIDQNVRAEETMRKRERRIMQKATTFWYLRLSTFFIKRMAR